MGRTVRFAHSLALSTDGSTGAFATPTGTGTAANSVDISSWKDPAVYNYVPDACAVFLTGTGQGDTDKPLGVYGIVTAADAPASIKNKAFLLAALNGGAVVQIGGATTGYSQELDGLGGFDKLAIGGIDGNTATFANAITVTATFVPILSRP